MVMFDPYTRPPQSAMRIVVLGGTGFVGHALVHRLTDDGHRVKILTRNREAHRDLLVHPSVEIVTANVHDAEALTRHFEDVDVVINLVGTLNEKGHNGKGFHKAHTEFTQRAIDAACRTEVPRFLQMSALGAAMDAPSHYQRTKAEAEGVALARCDETRVTVFRPSVIFGEGDGLTNRFAHLLGMVPMVFPLACSETRFAPVYVKDVAEAFARSLSHPETFGKRIDLCGPEVFTLYEIVDYVRCLQKRRHTILPLPDFLSKVQAAIFEFIPGKPFSLDNYHSTLRDNVCSGSNGLRELGIEPTPMDAVVPNYLTEQRPRRNYDRFRRNSRGSRYS